MEPETKACHWWTDPADGRRYFIPGCYGRMHGEPASRCTCSPVAKRRRNMRHVGPIEDYANVVRAWAVEREQNARQRQEIRELKKRLRDLQASIDGLATIPVGMANRESIDAVHFTDWDLAEKHGPGAFVWDVQPDRRALIFCLPGETFGRSIYVNQGPPLGEGVWGWDGNVEKPTITPSILAWERQTERVEAWHGYLSAGRFVSC